MLNISRYEIEYIVNRIFIGHDIGRRFLDIEPQLELRNGGEGDGSECLDPETREELLLNSNNANPTETAETENCNNTTANNCNSNKINSNTNTNSSSNHKKLQLNDTHNHNGDDATLNGGGGGGNGDGNNGDDGDAGDEGVECGDSQDAEKGGTSGTGSGSDELVLDVLNDDLIAQVRNKLNSGGKDLFAHCVKAVKAFLAGEPFREFENSMYFHR